MPLPDISSLASLGGAIANYAPVTDPTTDEDAKYRNRYVTDVAAMGHTAARAWVRFVGVSGSTPADPASNVHDAVWGSSVGVKPVVTRASTGVWAVTWPTTVSDELTSSDPSLGGGVTHTVSVRFAVAQATAFGGALRHAVAEVTSANVVTVRGFLADGTVSDLSGSTITVLAF